MSWPEVPLHDLCRPKQWPTIAVKNLSDDGYPVYGANGIIGFHSEYTHPKPVLLIGCRGSCGNVIITEPMSYCNGNAMALDELDTTRIDLRYLYHFLKARGFDDIVSGSGQPQITQTNLRRVMVSCPPITEQRRIAAILDKADEIKQDTATIFSLRNKIITSIFTELFGDTYTNSNFDTIKLSKLIDVDRGISYGVVQRGQHIEDGVPLIRIRDIINNNFDANGLVKTNKENSDKYKRTILQGGEFLISIRGTVGKLAIVPDHARGWNVTREVAVIPFTTEIDRTYLLYFLKSQGAQTKILGDVKGVAQSGINLRDLRELDVLIPPPELAEKFAIMVESVKSMPVTHELAKMNSFSIIQNMLA
jgi:type I restriction enzyme, S subunit